MSNKSVMDPSQIAAIDKVLAGKDMYEIILARFSDRGTMDAAHCAHTPLPVRMLINNRISGIVIGRGGMKIREIAAETETKCTIANEVIDIFGTGLACTRAVRMILEAILDAPDNISARARSYMSADGRSFGTSHDPDDEHASSKNSVVLRLLCHDGLVGRLLGKAGSHVKTIVQQTGCNVILSTEKDLPQMQAQHSALVRNPRDRVITIRGRDVNSVVMAESLISDTMRVGFLQDDMAVGQWFISKKCRQRFEVEAAMKEIGDCLDQADCGEHPKDWSAYLARLDAQEAIVSRCIYQARSYAWHQMDPTGVYAQQMQQYYNSYGADYSAYYQQQGYSEAYSQGTAPVPVSAPTNYVTAAMPPAALAAPPAATAPEQTVSQAMSSKERFEAAAVGFKVEPTAPDENGKLADDEQTTSSTAATVPSGVNPHRKSRGGRLDAAVPQYSYAAYDQTAYTPEVKKERHDIQETQ